MEPQGSFSPQPAQSLLTCTQASDFQGSPPAPRILVGIQAMLPLGNRNKCPVNTPLSAPKGLNMQREFCWEPPSNHLLCPWG